MESLILVPKKNSEVVSEGDDFFSVWAMIVLGGELASEVGRRRIYKQVKQDLNPHKHTELLSLWKQKHRY